MANIELFSCIVPVDSQRAYSADEHIDQRLMQNVWSLSETLNEHKIRVPTACGACHSATNIYTGGNLPTRLIVQPANVLKLMYTSAQSAKTPTL
jgi:hypothetical protein